MSQSNIVPYDAFTAKICRLRDAYKKKFEESNLHPPRGQTILDVSLDDIDGVLWYTYWYATNSAGDHHSQCIRLADIPRTLSGEILRLGRALPSLTGDYEVFGNDVRPLKHAPSIPSLHDDSEDTSDLLSLLPEIQASQGTYFLKKGKYRSEIQNLLLCQGGSCPGVPISRHIIQLLGKSSKGELVFEKYSPRYVLTFVQKLATYKNWILQVISGLKCLHSVGIIHRDLRIDNIVFSEDLSRVLICDLEGRWGNRLAPEVSRQPILDSGWSERSDVYDLGPLIRGMVYGNVPITHAVEWNVPEPLDAIVDICTHPDPTKRPSLDELYDIVEKLEV